MADYINAWQCIGCGRLERPQPCVGVCQDRAVELVHAADYEESLAAAEHLASLVRQLATTTPRNGEWERSYREMQRRAREVLGIPRTPNPCR